MNEKAIELLEKAKDHYWDTLEPHKDIVIKHIEALLKQQPIAGEYDTRTIKNTYICPCGNVFFDADDYDTLGSESGVCCPNCGNEKFQTVKDRLDTLEAINADLLAALEKYGLHKYDCGLAVIERCNIPEIIELGEKKFKCPVICDCGLGAAIAKAQSSTSVTPERKDE